MSNELRQSVIIGGYTQWLGLAGLAWDALGGGRLHMATGFINKLPLRKTRVSNIQKRRAPKGPIPTVTVIALMTVAVISIGGPAAQGTPPGENGAILFAADDGSGFELYTIEPDGTNLHQLTNFDANAINPDWSPDGGRIAFQLERTGNSSDIMIMDADGSNMQDLTPTGYEGSPSFTPDGQQLVYECDCFPQGIFIMDVDGTDRHRVTTHAFRGQPDMDPNLSPDGETVTFVRHKESGVLQSLHAVDIDGSDSEKRQLVPYKREVAIKHDWAPDGQQIVITINADYPHGRSPNVATIRPNGSDLRRLTSYEGGKRGAFAGSYSPDGTWIVFRVENLERKTFRLFRMHPDGSGRELIATLPFAPRSIDWGSLSDG
jgi:Tol biopolymer transport system component